jgi:hypothetical protein
MDESTLDIFRMVLDMPGASLGQMCERIRTLMQTEMNVEYLMNKHWKVAGDSSESGICFLDVILEKHSDTRDKS